MLPTKDGQILYREQPEIIFSVFHFVDKLPRSRPSLSGFTKGSWRERRVSRLVEVGESSVDETHMSFAIGWYAPGVLRSIGGSDGAEVGNRDH